MTVAEVRVIREKQSLETVGMTTEELRAYFAKGANEVQKMIDEIRREKGIIFKVMTDSVTAE
jgi:hypothetical protein